MQEQCLPFTAANGLGFLIGSPIRFGLCSLTDVPPGAQAFRAPVEGPSRDERVYYVMDDPRSRFSKNAFTFEPLELRQGREKVSFTPLQPGLSFFEREDQADLFKVHLPYIWRTPPEVDTLFLPPMNRPTPGITALCGLVETGWYANPVNLVFSKPPEPQAVHVARSQPIAQAVFVARGHRRAKLELVASHARHAREFRADLGDWYRQHAQDRSAYKKLAWSEHGRL